MKFKKILTLCMAGMSMCAFAQTHVDGEEYYKADQFVNAYDLLTRSLKNPQTDKAVSDYYLGMISIKADKNNDALNFFKQGIAANPNYAYNYVGEGLLQLMAGDKKGAEKLFKEAQKYAKKDASLEVAIARAYYDVDPVKYEKEINKQLEKARKYNMDNPDIYIFEGDQFKEQVYKADQQARIGLIGQAAGMYEMAKNYDKKSSAAYVKYANLYQNFNQKYAIQMLQELLKENPSSALGQRELARTYENMKDFKNAADQYGKYVANPAHFKTDESKYSFLLFYDGDYKKGYDYASQLLSEDPNNFEAQRYQFMNAAQLDDMNGQLYPLAQALWAKRVSDPSKYNLSQVDYNLIVYAFEHPGEGITPDRDQIIQVIQDGVKEWPDNSQLQESLKFYTQPQTPAVQ